MSPTGTRAGQAAPLTSSPPPVPNVLVTFPIPHVMLVTLNRPAQLNAIPTTQHPFLLQLFNWYDAEPHLRAAVITGTGRAFCAGADLKEWHDNNDAAAKSSASPVRNPASIIKSIAAPKPADTARPTPAQKWPADGGFGGISNRRGKKPIIAAVNGLCLGGGFEMVVNTDLIYALESAKFGLPEVTRGVVAIAGALPRLIRTLGRQRASEMSILGGMYTARQMEAWGIVNEVIEGDRDALIKRVLDVAAKLADNSPDAVIVTREGLLAGWAAEDPQPATNRVEGTIYKAMEGADNMREGVLSFVEKRKAVWKDSKL
ncbi:carnitinyl-CoA dehydratase [Plectosphaerella plurivora]|uniref:Carnitinyl-CoA dehydratase n=1 Tax=Plectosphaerella plurivora TaxID=936078 RepID=A0A9P9AB13_9PEZI|nr:carnitinyl-CoA dehydratase [Plectosphaerella plurivora]